MRRSDSLHPWIANKLVGLVDRNSLEVAVGINRGGGRCIAGVRRNESKVHHRCAKILRHRTRRAGERVAVGRGGERERVKVGDSHGLEIPSKYIKEFGVSELSEKGKKSIEGSIAPRSPPDHCCNCGKCVFCILDCFLPRWSDEVPNFSLSHSPRFPSSSLLQNPTEPVCWMSECCVSRADTKLCSGKQKHATTLSCHLG